MQARILCTAAAVIGMLAPGLHGGSAAAEASAGARCGLNGTPALSLTELTRAAGTVVVGRVARVQVAHHPRYRNLTVTHVTVRVADTWKGRPGRSMTFTQFGNASVASALPVTEVIERLPGLPEYREGEEVLLFLRTPSHAGLTSPVGGTMGKLAVRRDPGTGKAYVRGAVADLPATASAAGSRDGWMGLATVRTRVMATGREGRQR